MGLPQSLRFPRGSLARISLFAGLSVVAGISASVADASKSVYGQSARTSITMELIDQRYGFGPNEAIRMVYRLTGDLASIELTEPLPIEPAPVEPLPIEPAPVEPAPVEPAPVTLLSIQVTNYPPLTDSSDIDGLVGGDVDRAAFGSDAIDGIEITDVRGLAAFNDDGSVTLTVDVPTDVADSVEERLKFDRPGLYPIRTEILFGTNDAEGVVATHGTIVQRLPGPAEPPTPSPPIHLAVVTAVEPILPGMTTTEESATLADFDEAIHLATVLASPVTLDVPPPIVATVASTPDGATQLEASLAGDEFVAAPAVPLDVSSVVAVGRADLFAQQLIDGEDILTAAVPTTPSRRDGWIAVESLSATGAEELRDLGFRFLMMPQSLYRDTVDEKLPATDLFVEAALPDGGTLPLIVVSSLSDELTSLATNEVLRSSTPIEWAVRAVTTLLVDQAADDPLLERSNVLSTPDLSAPDPRLLAGLETLLGTTPSAQFVSASSLIGTTDTQTQGPNGRAPLRVDLPATAGPSLEARVALLDATALSVASAGSMLARGDPRPAGWAAQLEGLVSTGYSDEQVTSAIGEIQAEADALRDAVIPPQPFTFTLTGKSGNIEVRIRNTSDEPLDLIVRLSSPKVSFPGSLDPSSDTGDHHVTLRPNDETSLEIPVRAKSNGTSPIKVELLTPAGESLGEPVTLTSRVTAFTGLGQVLTAGFVLVLLTWWFAQWRGRRRAAIGGVRERHPSGAK